MAIFGRLKVVKEHLKDKKFDIAFQYLEQVVENGTKVNQRLLNLPVGAFEKRVLDDMNFALEQVYNSKLREECFFESHNSYIDVQFILDGEETIEVVNNQTLRITSQYNKDIDLIKYDDTKSASSLKLQKGDIAIFFPEDAHMPCLQTNKSEKVVKTVVKVAV
jgi:YhcH/YjgK/YiaL family protein